MTPIIATTRASEPRVLAASASVQTQLTKINTCTQQNNLVEVPAQAITGLKHLHDAIRNFSETMGSMKIARESLKEEKTAYISKQHRRRIKIEMALFPSKVATPLPKLLAIGIDELSAQISSSATPKLELTTDVTSAFSCVVDESSEAGPIGSMFLGVLTEQKDKIEPTSANLGAKLIQSAGMTNLQLNCEEPPKLADANFSQWRAPSSCADIA